MLPILLSDYKLTTHLPAGLLGECFALCKLGMWHSSLDEHCPKCGMGIRAYV